MSTNHFDDLPVLTDVVIPAPTTPVVSTAPAVPPAPAVSPPAVPPELAVSPPPAVPPVPAVPAPAVPPPMAVPVTDIPLAISLSVTPLQQALIDTLHRRLVAELPTLIEAALQSALPVITEEIRQGLEESTRDALGDMLKD